MAVEDEVLALTHRMQQLEASVNTLLYQMSVMEANAAPRQLASPEIAPPKLDLLLENGRPLADTFIHEDIRIGSSLAQPTRWVLDGEDIGIFEYGWYNLDIPVGEHTMEIHSLDGSLSNTVTFNIIE